MTLLRGRLPEERGWALVTSILVIGILISLSLPLLSLVDTQQAQTAQERKSESSFNLAEAALDASVFVLGKRWPAAEGTEHPLTCDAASTDLDCPSPDILTRSYSGGDYTNRGWTVQVRDDTGSEYYDPDPVLGVPSRPRWDENDNEKLWVRADAHAADGDRSVVMLVRRIDQIETFPRNAITAGWFEVTTGGNKMVVDTQGESVQARPVAVRCTPTSPPPSPGCLDYVPENNQVSPDTSEPGYTAASVIPPDALARMRATAQALDSYHPSGCPQFPDGELVFVESGDCRYAGGGTANEPDKPGMFIVANGTLTFGGGMTYYGMAYGANLQGSTGIVVSIYGGATIVGSIAADGGGGVSIGSSGDNLIYDDAVFPLIRSFAAAAPVQGSWRELPAS